MSRAIIFFAIVISVVLVIFLAPLATVEPLRSSLGEEVEMFQTATPAPPIPTPVIPAMGPVPTVNPTAAAFMPAESRAYLQAVTQPVAAFDQALNQLNQLLGSPHPEDATWRQNVSQQLETLRNINIAVQSLGPPTDLTPAHETLEEATASCNQAAELLTDGLEVSVSAMLERGLAPVQRCNAQFDEAISQLNAYLQGVNPTMDR